MIGVALAAIFLFGCLCGWVAATEEKRQYRVGLWCALFGVAAAMIVFGL